MKCGEATRQRNKYRFDLLLSIGQLCQLTIIRSSLAPHNKFKTSVSQAFIFKKFNKLLIKDNQLTTREDRK